MKFHILFLMTVICLVCSCVPMTYVQENINAPFIDEKSEFHITGYLSPRRIELQTAFSVNSSIVLIANGYTKFKDYRIMSGSQSNKLIDFGAGYYNKINHHNLEIFIGGGKAWASADLKRHWSSDYNIECITFKSDYYKFFSQFDYAFNVNHIKIGFALRYNYVVFPAYNYEIVADYYEDGPKIYGTDTIHLNNIHGQIIDPVIHIQYGNRIKLCSNIGYSLSFFPGYGARVSYSDPYSYSGSHGGSRFFTHPKYNRLIFNFGIKYIFGGKKR